MDVILTFYQDLLRKYKFVLAFENSATKDYVTEKFFDALDAGAVPVVYGAPNIHDFEPGEKSIIVADDFEYAFESLSGALYRVDIEKDNQYSIFTV